MRRIALVVALLCGSNAHGQTGTAAPLPRVEIVAAWSLVPPVSGGSLDAAYAPPLRQGGTAIESRSLQALTADTGIGQGIEFATNVFVSPWFGLQAALAWSRADLSGANPDYDVFLRYVARPPPDYVPREFTYERSSTWQDTAGTLGQTAVFLGGVARWRARSAPVGGTVSAGLSFARTAGEVDSLAYTRFILGGHSTLFPVTHRVVMIPAEEQWAIGPYVGGDVHLRVANRVAVLGGLRLVFAGRQQLLVAPDQLVDPDEEPFAPEIDDVRETMGVQPLDLPATRWRVLVGVKLFVGPA